MQGNLLEFIEDALEEHSKLLAEGWEKLVFLNLIFS